MIVLKAHREVDEVLVGIARHDSANRRLAKRRQNGAAGEVKRQAEAERDPFLHLGDGRQPALRGYEVEAANLVVWAKITPVRSFRPVLPPLGHTSFSLSRGQQSFCLE